MGEENLLAKLDVDNDSIISCPSPYDEDASLYDDKEDEVLESMTVHDLFGKSSR